MALHLYANGLLSDDYNAVGFPLSQSEELLELLRPPRPASARWRPEPLRIFDDCGRDGDFPSLVSYNKIPVFSERAWRALCPLIGERVEALSLSHPQEPHYIINVLDVVDCLDVDRSKVTRNGVTGRVSRVWHYALKNEHLLAGKHIFWTPTESGSDMMVDDEFCKCVEQHNLLGLKFQPLP